MLIDLLYKKIIKQTSDVTNQLNIFLLGDCYFESSNQLSDRLQSTDHFASLATVFLTSKSVSDKIQVISREIIFKPN